MGPMEIPSQSSETIKIPTAHYEFGANFIDPKVTYPLLSKFVYFIFFDKQAKILMKKSIRRP
jgi:hypothetical protein